MHCLRVGSLVPLSYPLISTHATMIELVDIDEATFPRYSSNNVVDGSITTKIHALDNDVPSAKHCIICLNALLKRLYPLDKMEWLEQSIVTRVYLTGKYPPTQTAEGVKDLRRVFDGFPPSQTATHLEEVRKNLTAPLSSKSVCSVQMVRALANDHLTNISCYGKSQIHTSLNGTSKIHYHGVY